MSTACLLYAMIDQQPSLLGPYRRRAGANFQAIPPWPTVGREQHTRQCPVEEVIGRGIPDMFARAGYRAVEHEPRPIGLFRKNSGIFVVWGHYQTKSLYRDKVLGFCQCHARPK